MSWGADSLRNSTTANMAKSALDGFCFPESPQHALHVSFATPIDNAPAKSLLASRHTIRAAAAAALQPQQLQQQGLPRQHPPSDSEDRSSSRGRVDQRTERENERERERERGDSAEGGTSSVSTGESEDNGGLSDM